MSERCLEEAGAGAREEAEAGRAEAGVGAAAEAEVEAREEAEAGRAEAEVGKEVETVVARVEEEERRAAWARAEGVKMVWAGWVVGAVGKALGARVAVERVAGRVALKGVIIYCEM